MNIMNKKIEGESRQFICVQDDAILIHKNRKSEKFIRKDDIKEIRYFPAKILANGFIEFVTTEHGLYVQTPTEAKKDENSISFIHSQKNEFEVLSAELNHELFNFPIGGSAIIAEEKLGKQANSPMGMKQRIAESKAKGIACCPKCGSTSLSANKKGFGVGKAVVGAYIAGPIGLVAGNIHAKKVWVTCLNCGHRWKI